MTASVLPQIQDSLRGTGLSSAANFELSLLLLVWAKLSCEEAIPAELRLTANLIDEPKKIYSVFSVLSDSDREEFIVFTDLQRLISGSPGLFLPAVQMVVRFMKAGLISELDVTQLLDSSSRSPYEEGLLPREIAALLVDLSEARAGKTVYLPWDSLGQVASFAVKAGMKACVETPSQSPIPALVALLSKSRFELHHSDPLRSPSVVQDGKPRKFDVGIAFPPFGIRYDIDVAEHDWFGRFPERTTSGAVLAVRQLLWQAKERVVIAVANSLLFSTGAEFEMRRDLIQKGMVESVVGMRSGLLTHTTMPFSILILDPRGDQKQINFVDADSERFTEPISKARFRLIDRKGLVELVTRPADSPYSKIISVNELGPDEQLQVSRYVVPETTKQLLSMISAAKTARLGDLVQTVRPMMSNSSAVKDPIEAREVGAADIPPYGFIKNASRPVKIDGAMADKNEKQFLRPLDIVLVVKGSVGKVGIVSPDAPEPGPGGWVAGQSTIVLRASNKAAVDPRTLVLQLRSEMGQTLLNGIVSGSVIPLIQLRELMLLPIVLPALEQQRRAAEALDRESAMQDEIDRLRHAQSEVAADLWAFKPSGSVTAPESSLTANSSAVRRKTHTVADKPARKIREE